MAEELIIRHWCDGHLSRNDERVAVDPEMDPEGIMYPVDLGNGPRKLDLCGDCRDTMSVAQFIELYLSEGRGIKPSRREAAEPRADTNDSNRRTYPCPWCIEREDRPYLTLEGVKTHIRVHHGVDPADFPRKCPVCGRGVAGRHVLSDHGMTYYAALVAARKAGDPYGVLKIINAMNGAQQ